MGNTSVKVLMYLSTAARVLGRCSWLAMPRLYGMTVKSMVRNTLSEDVENGKQRRHLPLSWDVNEKKPFQTTSDGSPNHRTRNIGGILIPTVC